MRKKQKKMRNPANCRSEIGGVMTRSIFGVRSRRCLGAWRFAALITLQTCISCNIFAADAKSVCDGNESKGCITSAEYFEHIRKRASSPNPLNFAGASVKDPLIGLALAGGGTRASQISIGVLKGLHEAGLLSKVKYLSTVSGGGYAGYWYVSQRLNNASDDELFADCIPSRYTDIVKTLGKTPPDTCTIKDAIEDANSKDANSRKRCFCPEKRNVASAKEDSTNFTNVLSNGLFGAPGTKYFDPYRFQNSLRGHTDLFAPTFSYTDTRRDNRFVPSVLLPAVSQFAMALTVDILGDVVFDWNVNASPSRVLYREGILRVYGLPPLDCASYLNKTSSPLSLGKKENCMDERPLIDEVETDQAYRLPTFDDLRSVESSGKGSIPNWVINATTPVLNCPHVSGDESCVQTEFFSSNPYPPHKAAFEFTTDYWGAGEFGYWPVGSGSNPFEGSSFELINAVSSSAAFFDPNEKTFTLGGVGNLLQQAFGFKWGYYLRNPHVSDDQRVLHRALIFPLYLMHRWRENKDAVDIHLIDGGQSDNLGAYALIRRRVPNIIISDHASEAIPGNMEDICSLKRSLGLPEFAASNGEKVWHIQFDQLPNLSDICNSSDRPGKDRKVYNVRNWKHPVIEGCAVEVGQMSTIPADASCESLRLEFAANDSSRHLKLFLIKPAIDLSKYQSEPYEQLRKDSPADLASATEIVGFIKNNIEVRTENDGALLFPSHGTVDLTLDSSPWLFGAYRELAAQAARSLFTADNGWLSVKPDFSAEQQKAITVEEMKKESAALTEKLRFKKH